jgi:hypothetical protein
MWIIRGVFCLTPIRNWNSSGFEFSHYQPLSAININVVFTLISRGYPFQHWPFRPVVHIKITVFCFQHDEISFL